MSIVGIGKKNIIFIFHLMTAHVIKAGNFLRSWLFLPGEVFRGLRHLFAKRYDLNVIREFPVVERERRLLKLSSDFHMCVQAGTPKQ